MKSAIEGIKDLEIQVKQWQGRLDFAKSENERLVRSNEALKGEDKSIRCALQQDAEAKLLEVRKAKEAVYQDRKALDDQKAEFIQTLTAFKSEKNAFEIERQTILNMKTGLQEKSVKVDQFIRLVRGASEGL